MANAMRGLRVRPRYEDWINVAEVINYILLDFQIVMLSF